MAEVSVSSFLLFLLILWTPLVQAYPDGGRKVCTDFNSTTSLNCSKAQTLLNGGLIFVKLYFNGTAKGVNVKVKVESGQTKGSCPAPCTEDGTVSDQEVNDGQGIVQKKGENSEHLAKICGTPSRTDEPTEPTSNGSPTPSQTLAMQSTSPASPSPTPTLSPPPDLTSGKRRGSTSQDSRDLVYRKPPTDDWDSDESTALYEVESDEIYWVTVVVSGGDKVTKLPLRSISITLKNPYGYLDAADYPAMVFYAVMLVVYLFLAVVWGILLCYYYKDLIRLQFFIAVAILLGILEKTFFVAEYAVVNTKGVSSNGYFPEYLVVAEAVSALKKTFARILLIIVSSGYGTVIPRLGPLLKWLMLFGVLFFVAAFTDGVVRATYYVTRGGLPPSVLGAFIPQLVLDVIFIYWIINAIVSTRRTLRLRRNIKKLAFYNHLLYTFAFAVIGIAAFCIWFYVSGMIARCEDLQSLWLKECFWHIIFTVLLIVVMILWRPSSNAVRYAYALVHDEEEEEVEQKANKNLETISKRQKATGDEVVPPRPSHDMEEDLKWVEENLPTSTIDKVLQPFVDSDEDELMTSRFELSKMN